MSAKRLEIPSTRDPPIQCGIWGRFGSGEVTFAEGEDAVAVDMETPPQGEQPMVSGSKSGWRRTNAEMRWPACEALFRALRWILFQRIARAADRRRGDAIDCDGTKECRCKVLHDRGYARRRKRWSGFRRGVRRGRRSKAGAHGEQARRRPLRCLQLCA